MFVPATEVPRNFRLEIIVWSAPFEFHENRNRIYVSNLTALSLGTIRCKVQVAEFKLGRRIHFFAVIETKIDPFAKSFTVCGALSSRGATKEIPVKFTVSVKAIDIMSWSSESD